MCLTRRSVLSRPTVLYGRNGEINHLKQGAYQDEKALAEDIEAYAR